MHMETIDLGGQWKLCGFDGYGRNMDDRSLPEALTSLVWIDAEVPGSVYLDLMRAGWIDDVYTGCNTLAARWVEQHYWYYRRLFDAPAAASGHRCFLVFEGLDLDGLIFLNGQVIGEHHNAFRPCRIDVTGQLRERDNELIVRIDSGLISAADKRGGDYYLETTAMMSKRAHLRKPQFACRWDWSPRLMNVGIGGGVRVEVCDPARIDQVVITPDLDDDHGAARLHVRALVENVTEHAQPLSLRCRLADGSIADQVDASASPGDNELTCTLKIDRPRLWWPRSMGEQHRYEVEVSLVAGGQEIDSRRCWTGVRSVEIRQDPDPQGGKYFHLVVTGQPVFCKGAHWVPADLIYPSVKRKDYEELVALAAECGFNMLRVWGGGRYEDHAFFDACDRAGILVWHDFMFACSKYPGQDEAFTREVRAEAEYNVRELARHPSLVVWCGNNEIEQGVTDGWITSNDPDTRPDEDLFHKVLADVVKDEDGSRPYWPTSPWSPDGSPPNNQNIGDQHPWYVGLGEAKGDYWQYRSDASRFPNEGGLLGPSTPKTLRQILPESERAVASRTWMHHDNTQNSWRGQTMVDHLLQLNFCDQPDRLGFEDYVRYASILQGEALETAIDNWRRRKFDSAAAVFWMFNDTWPATVSWTPIDYYRRRKASFWYVKRAFADLRAICVELDGELAVFVVNDSIESRTAVLRYGLFGLGGGRPIDETIRIDCPPNSAIVAARFTLAQWDQAGTDTHGAFAVLTGQDGGEIATHRLFRQRFKDLAWARADIVGTPGDAGLGLVSDQFAWAVCLDPDGEQPLADNYFDLIPGIERMIPWPADRPVPQRVRAANPTHLQDG